MQSKLNNRREELLWQAFLYAAGELNATDSAIFEALLAEDLVAQEVLAEVMQLSALTCTAVTTEKVGLAASSENTSVSKWPMVWGSLLSVLLLVTIYSTKFSGEHFVGSATDAELAELWSHRLTDTAALSEMELAIPEDIVDTDLVSAENAFPAWMLDAIRAAESAELPESDASEEMES